MSEHQNNERNLPPRLEWLMIERVPKTANLLKAKENIDLDHKQILDSFVKADPSSNHSAVQWLMDAYCRDGFLWEDIDGGNTSKVFETLQWFARYKQNLPLRKRNVYVYAKLADLYQAVDPYVIREKELANSKIEKDFDQKDLAKIKALKETYTLSDKPNLKIVIPLTKEASQWWGKGTRWCTAANKNNYFHHYNDKAPLMILLFKDHENKSRKLQLWEYKFQTQWMDETDDQIDDSFIKNNLSVLKPVVLFLSHKRSQYLKLIRDHEFDLESYKIMIEQNGNCLNYVPQNMKTYELCLSAVSNKGNAINYVPKDFLTDELCLAAVRTGGDTLYSIPHHMLNQKIFEAAVQANPNMIKGFFKNEAFDKIINQNEFFEPNLVKKLLKISLSNALSNDGLVIFNIPRKMVTLELVKIACQQNGCALQMINIDPNLINNECPPNYKQDLCMIAVEQNGFAIAHVPNNLLSQELCELAVKQNGLSLHCIHYDMRTKKVCELAIDQNGLAITHVPIPLLNNDLCKIAVEQNPEAIDLIPEEFKTAAIVKIAKEISEQILANKKNPMIEDIKRRFLVVEQLCVAQNNLLCADNITKNSTFKP